MGKKAINFFVIIGCFFVFVSCATYPENKNKNKNPTIKEMQCYKEAAKEILKWDKVKGKEMKGLKIRREKENELFLDGCES